MNWRAWTEEEINILRQGVNGGKSYPQIARELGRSESAVGNRARELGIQRNANLWSAEEDEVLRTMFKAGFGLYEIAMRINRSSSGIKNRAIRLGILKKSKTNIRPKETLCWTCSKSTGPKMCVWARRGNAISGWKVLRGHNDVSHSVIECPEYDREARA